MASDLGPVTAVPNTTAHPGPLSVTSATPTTSASIAPPPFVPAVSDAAKEPSGKQTEPSKLGTASNKPSNLSPLANAGLSASPTPVSPKSFNVASPTSPRPLTGVAAVADERRTAREARERYESTRQSPNPASSALGALRGQELQSSRPEDAPKPMSSPISASDPMQIESNERHMDTNASPQTHTTDAPLTSSPNATSARDEETQAGHQPDTPSTSDDKSNRAFTFPGPVQTIGARDSTRSPVRGMSLPNSESSHNVTKSGSARKHKCPYCATDFTRHHNLKSHLLTHSHEKPFICSTCQARFRRLHDLKRHTKLHTGERPHTCNRCGRSFARGDALARHNKGQGGCAGRRASQGDYAGDDDSMQTPGDDSMDGLMYTGDGSNDVDRMDEEEPNSEDRRTSLPAIKAHETQTGAVRPGGPSSASDPPPSSKHSSTYPPAPRRDAPHGLLHPRSSHGGSSNPPLPLAAHGTVPGSTVNSSASSAPLGAGGSSILAQGGGMTESPGPLSPANAPQHQYGSHDSASIHRNRSPSLTQQFQQHHYGRRSSGRTPPPVNLPPMQASSNAPQLPSLPGLAPPDTRYSMNNQSGSIPHSASQTSPIGQPLAGVAPPTGLPQPSAHHAGSGSTAGSGSSHERLSGEGPLSSGNDRLWAYCRTLEDRVNRLADEVTMLRGEISSMHRR